MDVLRIAIVAGEASGDYLGAQLMESIKKLHPHVKFDGIAGPKMIASGCQAYFDLERLSVTGFTEVLSRLFELIGIRRQLLKRWHRQPPHIFIGIDAPAFNLGLESSLRKMGITTVHYVSPQIWAWKPGRIKKIKNAIRLMLTVFPFETEIYRQNEIEVEFVGHPLADDIPMHSDKRQARKDLGVNMNGNILALLPGSRMNEIRALASDFIQGAQLLQQELPDLSVLIPLVDPRHRIYVEKLHDKYAPRLPIKYCMQQARSAITAADAVLLASGTASLETLLIKRPMVVAYRLNSSTYWFAKRMVQTQFIAMPNLLAGSEVVPELVQSNVEPTKIASALLRQFTDQAYVSQLTQKFQQIHETLRKNASIKAAQAVLGLAGSTA